MLSVIEGFNKYTYRDQRRVPLVPKLNSMEIK